MGTKNKPGKFDCYSAAKVDEPMFILLARDPLAPFLIAIWAQIRVDLGEDPNKVAEARQCADDCVKYLRENYPEKVERLKLIGERLTEMTDCGYGLPEQAIKIMHGEDT